MKNLERIQRSRLMLGALRAVANVKDKRLERNLIGLKFPNPVGLAGGFDKDGRCFRAFEAMGFGFIELGTVTWHPQPGNPRPRVFRFPEEEAIINRFGFNNEGARAMAERLAMDTAPRRAVMGISLGKSKVTELKDAVDDYLQSLRVLYAHGDYFAVNVSSPNTPGLRELQDKKALDDLLAAMDEEGKTLQRRLTGQTDKTNSNGKATGNHKSAANSISGDNHKAATDEKPFAEKLLRTNPSQTDTPRPRLRKPILVKVAPDLEPQALDELLEVCVRRNVDGLIATNTTLSRDGLNAETNEPGGLSGRPLFPRSVAMVSHIRRQLPQMPLIGVGGIMTPENAQQMIQAGADMIQIYTALIYQGPMFARRVNGHLKGIN